MPMPDLDPRQYVPTVLGDPTHRVPMPDKGGRFFSQDPAAPETVDIFDPFYAALLADGSIRRACPVALAAAKDAAADKTAAETSAAERTSAEGAAVEPAPDASTPPSDGRPAA